MSALLLNIYKSVLKYIQISIMAPECVGIRGFELYFPKIYVEQDELEKVCGPKIAAYCFLRFCRKGPGFSVISFSLMVLLAVNILSGLDSSRWDFVPIMKISYLYA